MTLTEIPERTVKKATSFVTAASGGTRRGFLLRATAVGAAIAAAPVRFLLEPADALAAPCPQPGGCGSGLCTDGYSAFCCTLTGSNNCPPGTSPGGWWYACVPTNYCSSGTRYYLDCIGDCPSDCSGCQCVNNSCGNRRVCCNHGYTNCGGSSSAYLRCRIVRCVNPANLGWGCSSVGVKSAVTCSHGGACTNAPGTSCQSLSCSP